MEKPPYLTTGVLGGMGPQATVDFMTKIIRQTPAQLDQDHIPLIIDHNPLVPNRHKSLNGSGDDAKAPLIEMAKKLEGAGAHFLVMVCNTAHAYHADIQGKISIPFISIVDEVVAHIQENYPSVKNIGIMAADGCLHANIYQQALLHKSFVPIQWHEDRSRQFMELLFRIKTGNVGDESRKEMVLLSQYLSDAGAELIISGCTEIPLVMTAKDIDIPLIESTDILVQQTIAYATQKSKLPSIEIA